MQAGNEITDLSPIQNLTTLQNINFSDNKITDVSCIENLTSLRYCYLDNNSITNIRASNNLNQLQELSLAGNNIEDISPVINLEKLTNLDVSRNNISTISNIKSNQTIEKINLNYNKLQSLDGIEKLNNLQILSASNNKIENIDNVSNLTKLYNLNLNKNSISNISALSNCTNLEYLYLDSNKIISVTAIESLNNLKKITMYNQYYTMVIDKNYEDSDLQLTLTSFFTSLKNTQSKMYAKDVTCNESNGKNFTIADDFSYIIIKFNDLKDGDLVFSIVDENNIYITLVVTTYTGDINLEGTSYNIEDTSYVTNISTNTLANQFISDVNANKGYIQRNNEIFTDNRVLCNGDILKIGEKVYTIIVKADPSGDGKTNIVDLMQVQNHVLGKDILPIIPFMAADLNKDNVINIVDVMNFINIILKTSK